MRFFSEEETLEKYEEMFSHPYGHSSAHLMCSRKQDRKER
jgi:hypothetical protein